MEILSRKLLRIAYDALKNIAYALKNKAIKICALKNMYRKLHSMIENFVLHFHILKRVLLKICTFLR